MTEGASKTRTGPLVGAVFGRYVLVRLLGEGGMGAVYEATHQDLGRRVAVKTLHERYAASEDARRRFLREGRAAARIRHSNVADVYDVGIEGTQPYLVMELLEGEDLGRLLAREGALSVTQTADLLVPVIAAVSVAHDSGIVHRDLKPENILLASGRGGVTPKVLDFGISKLVDGESSLMTGTGAVLGTPHYMSPEQAQGDKEVDARSDQYSLGVVLYQCATGRRPLQGAPLYSLMQKTVHGDIPPPRQVQPALPSAFEAVILRAMARSPERRFATTRALGQALLPFAGDEVRSSYASELTDTGLAPPALPRLDVAALELSSTLGESAHVRAVAETRPARRPVAAVLGVLLLLGLLVWRLSGTASRAAPNVLPASAAATLPTGSGESSSAALQPAATPSASTPAPASEPARTRAVAPTPLQPAPAPAAARGSPPGGERSGARTPARQIGAATAAAPPAASPPSRAALPADDPIDGFVDIEPRAPAPAPGD